MLEQYPGKVKIVFKNFPSEGDRVSVKAAEAALAAKQQDRFWDLHYLLFAHLNDMDEGKIRKLAETAGLEMKQFTRDMQSTRIQALIQRDISEALKAKSSTIPTVFINGRKLEDRTLAGFQHRIDAELKKVDGTAAKATQGG